MTRFAASSDLSEFLITHFKLPLTARLQFRVKPKRHEPFRWSRWHVPAVCESPKTILLPYRQLAAGAGNVSSSRPFSKHKFGLYLEAVFLTTLAVSFHASLLSKITSRRNDSSMSYIFPPSSVFSYKTLLINDLWINMWISFEATTNERFRFSSMRICTVNKLGFSNYFKKSFFNFSSWIG